MCRNELLFVLQSEQKESKIDTNKVYLERSSGVKRISLGELLKTCKEEAYECQYRCICGYLEAGKIKPLKASGTNGKKPALYREYWLIEPKKDYSKLEEELKYQLAPSISVDYYLSHVENYERDRQWVWLLSEYLKHHRDYLLNPVSVNERSFEIWGREKFLSKEQGKRILKRCGLELDFLNIYSTTEPLAYYTHHRRVPQNLLILENKDTFYSMRRHLMEGNETLLGVEFGTIIYGAGKGILRSFQDFEFCVEPYMKAKGNRIYYFGDLDYEGIGIYESLAEMFAQKWYIRPFIPAYEKMLEKAAKVVQLPKTKEQQNRNIQKLFFSQFPIEAAEQMRSLLEKELYIPQEILNITDL